ncbi:hypothetical protein PHYSODRAFT_564312 [Phytophthora sojae]|uniref:SP-RING-type domain-containing protein n=1 Tax=Phytophthora sojae (strain P6497) TaxID=1094619 RepID=G5A2I0_PHYSP|nr:hypothetical protein PHYSODRAFT_564312 [Phytophthora sojae]EGZ09871.1 hypothetical protein PHYSODRAFT_564312 [Phytophthora sojae]|eukprot:XP_009534732.1 hypothetical protein PHYSODRAFT_564312 [Phytophthora sojae]
MVQTRGRQQQQIARKELMLGLAKDSMSLLLELGYVINQCYGNRPPHEMQRALRRKNELVSRLETFVGSQQSSREEDNTAQEREQLQASVERLQKQLLDQSAEFEQERARLQQQATTEFDAERALLLEQASAAADTQQDISRRNLTEREAALTCPISLDLFENPVVTECCGKTFSSEALNQALRRNSQCPVCRAHRVATRAGTSATNASKLELPSLIVRPRQPPNRTRCRLLLHRAAIEDGVEEDGIRTLAVIVLHVQAPSSTDYSYIRSWVPRDVDSSSYRSAPSSNTAPTQSSTSTGYGRAPLDDGFNPYPYGYGYFDSDSDY